MSQRFSAEHPSLLGVETKVGATDGRDTWEATAVSSDAQLGVWS